MNSSSYSGVRARPKQGRSERALQRIMEATAELLHTHSFDDLSVQQIAEAAGVAVGTVYQRFTCKDDLLPFVYAAYSEKLERDLQRTFARARSGPSDLRSRVAFLVRTAVKLYVTNRGLWRSMLLFRMERTASEELRAQRRRQLQPFADFLLECKDEIGHDRPVEAVRFALTTLMAICKDQILLNDASLGMGPPLEHRAIVHHATAMLTSYLKGDRAGRARQ